MKTFITLTDGAVDRIMQTHGESPGSGWIEVPNNFDGNYGDKYPDWFDNTGRRISDTALADQGKRVDNRGAWYNTERPGEIKQIYNLDEEPGVGWTKEPPLKDEPYQMWDEHGQRWIIDTEKKEAAEKEREIAEIQSKIVEYESKLQRPLIALADPGITPEAEAEERTYYNEYTGKIKELRAQKQELLSA